jgi:hypothetical protein
VVAVQGRTTGSSDEWIGGLHVHRVRLVVSAHGTKAFVEGVRHRRAVIEPMALGPAMRLRARGVPIVLQHVA